MRNLFLLSVAVLSLSSFTASEHTTEPAAAAPRVDKIEGGLRCVGYLTSWDYDNVFDRLDWAALTHINVGWCNPDKEGNLSMGWDDRTFAKVIERAHENGVKVMPSVRDGDPALFATAQSRSAFVGKILAYIEKYDLDGFDIDLEKSEPDFWTNYEAFIVELRGEFDKRDLVLSTAVSTWFSDNITDATFACFDFINIMAYDLGRPNHSTFEGMKRMAEHYRDARGIPAERIVCGVPFYGYNKATPETNFRDYKKYFELIAAAGVEAANNPAAERDESTVDGNVYAYNGRPTMARKCEFARDWGGVMIWSLAYDTTDEYSLLKVIRETLFESGAAPRPVAN
ncbi:MAG: hypothetical protein LBV38_08030 [Alistipes sp.]|jgi:GH18 family chitinase|nr:hypothetical protein [Alistipes sp.]